MRFLPADSTEYYALEAMGLELFNFPLDCEIEGDYENYRDPSISADTLTWQYTTVPVTDSIPQSIRSELLQECFIPDLEPSQSSSSVQGATTRSQVQHDAEFYSALESLAYSIANPLIEEETIIGGGEINSSNNYYPSGSIQVESDTLGVYKPVRGVKVRTRSFVKWASTYTDADGNYYISKSYKKSPHYSLKFENSKGFELMGTYLSLTPTWNDLGTHSNSGYDFEISKTHKAWFACAVNNGIYNYMVMCDEEGLRRPLPGLRVILLDNSGSLGGSGTPMLRHIGYQNLSNYTLEEISKALLHSATTLAADLFSGLVKYGLPDIIFLKSNLYWRMQSTVFHEMSHASHFAEAGTSLWLLEIAHIVYNWAHNNDLYGDGLTGTSGERATELIEAWAYARERRFQDQFGMSVGAGTSEWFSPAINAITNLMAESVLTPSEILTSMPATITSIDDLYSRLCTRYPSKIRTITDCFSREGALEKQSIWQLYNSKTYDYYINLYGSFCISHGDSIRIISIPNTVTSFSNLYSVYPSYYPSYMSISHDGYADYMESAPNNIYMGEPLLSRSGWAEQKDTIATGNKIIHRYTYSL